MKIDFFKTNNSLSPVILRVLLGIVILAHGSQKFLGWFGGYGFNGTMDFFTNSMELSPFIGFMVIVIEFFGSVLLIIGLATRFWSLLMILLFSGIIYTSHIQHGFFMNWFGNQKGEGYEFFLLAIGISLSLLLSGGGKYSLDGLVTKKS